MISLITPMPGQDHDVDGRMGVEPEQVLEEQRVAAESGSKMPMPKMRSSTSSSSVMASTGVASTMITDVA